MKEEEKTVNKNELLTLARYDFWANGRLLATAQSLTMNQLTEPLDPDPGWGTLRGILVHMLDTEFGWRATVQAQDADTILQEEDFPDIASLQAQWIKEEAAWLAFINGLTSEQLSQPYGDPPSGMVVWQTIMHVLLHSMQHRSEVAFNLTG